MSEVPPEVSDYLRNHTITTNAIDEHIEIAITSLLGSENFFSEVMHINSDRLSQIPIWGIIVAMLQRVYDYADSALFLLLCNQLPGSEITARTTAEAAINLMYILDKDTDERLMTYLADYYYREIEELSRWEKAAKALTDKHELQTHLDAIKNKRAAINTLPEVFREIGTVKFPKSKVEFPPISKRFKELGREIEYRTIFAALSSQVHNAPEDLINRILAGAASTIHGTDIFKTITEQQRLGFAKMLTFRAIGYYIEAINSCFTYFNLDSETPTVQIFLRELEKIYTSGLSDH